MGVKINLSKIGIPFSLNEGQRTVLKMVSDFLQNNSKDAPVAFSLKGYAGTGKSSIARILVSGITNAGK